MRVTNNMITGNTKNNINSNKVFVDKYNTQMTTQKKINRPSDDPVVAIRSLRMQTTLSHINQYLDNNIADVNSWLKVTDTALGNMTSILTDLRTQCVNGSTDTLTQDDRNIILKQLRAMADQVYSEGNADYAGRTVFTGYRTSSQLTFKTDEKDTVYNIDQTFSYEDLKDHRYYFGETEIPADADSTCNAQIGTNTYSRIRLAYDGTDSLDNFSYTAGGTTTTMGTVSASDVADGIDPAGKIDLEALCKAMGFERVRVVDPYNLEECDKVLKEELSVNAPSVIISRRPCALLKYVKHNAPLNVNKDKCVGCKSCMKVGCPAISIKNNKATIDTTLCVGCNVCSQLCPVGALE